MREVLTAALSHEPRDGLVGWAAQAVRRPVSDEGGDMSIDLIDAAVSGDVTEVRRMVAAGADVNELNEYGNSALHLIALGGTVEMVKALVELGADKNALGVGGGTPLHVAAMGGKVETVKLLAQLGAEPGVKNVHEETPLQMSVRLGHHQMAQVLRELERTAARTQKAAATSVRTRQPALAGHPGDERGGGAHGRRADRGGGARGGCGRPGEGAGRSTLAPHRAPQRAVGW
jgi:hypothetical protein